MRLLSPAIASALFALGAPALAGFDDAVHKKCLEARDYQGCVKQITDTAKKNERAEGEELLISGKCKINEYIFNLPIPVNGAPDRRVRLTFNEKIDLCAQLAKAKTDSSFDEVLARHDVNPRAYRSFLAAQDLDEQKDSGEKSLAATELCGPGEDTKWQSDSYYDCLNEHRELKVGSLDGVWHSPEVRGEPDPCPPGTNMITVDNRWNFLFFRGGKVKEIGCMSPQQLASFNAQVELGNREASRRIWRDAVNNMAADRRNQQLIDAVNQLVYCNTNSTMTGSIHDSGYGSANLYGSASSSTNCY